MSNIKEIDFKGYAPFDFIDHCDGQVIRFMAAMTGPVWGFKIKWLEEAFDQTRANEHGGQTAYYAFQISGYEAVSWSYLTGSLAGMRRTGVEFTVTRARDAEEDTDWLECNPKGQLTHCKEG